jgi:hypothetical protein
MEAGWRHERRITAGTSGAGGGRRFVSNHEAQVIDRDWRGSVELARTGDGSPRHAVPTDNLRDHMIVGMKHAHRAAIGWPCHRDEGVGESLPP